VHSYTSLVNMNTMSATVVMLRFLSAGAEVSDAVTEDMAAVDDMDEDVAQLEMQEDEEEVDSLIEEMDALAEEHDEEASQDESEEQPNSTAPASAKNPSAKHKKQMEAAKKKSVKTEKVVESLKKKQAKMVKQQQAQLALAAQAKKQASAVLKKMPACAKAAVAVDVKKEDLDKNTQKAKALAGKEAAKSSKKEHDTVIAHARKHANKASKALIAEEHDALHGKLMKHVLKIAEAEATKAAPIAAKKEVVTYHAQIMAKVKAEVAALVLKDATEVARGLAMKEVQDQMGKSKKVRALVASVAESASKYFAHKFSKQQLSSLVGDEAKRQLGARIQHHTELHIGGAEAAAKQKIGAGTAGPFRTLWRRESQKSTEARECHHVRDR